MPQNVSLHYLVKHLAIPGFLRRSVCPPVAVNIVPEKVILTVKKMHCICRVLGKLFALIVPLFTKQRNW